ncbi:hypothetical protein MATL_G00051620 [Megalops atlanticus]|uniref:GrpE protein homolog n=1 Tax=Megalops atlanticus TaxID=7932 RepID=A0A9D3QBF3_MEGAT|nr:hypothetical protein MATL_G00051620 [Megalops atlanticus]
MAVSRLSRFVKLQTAASRNSRALAGLYSTAAEHCSRGDDCHGDDTVDNRSRAVANVRMLEARASKLEEQVRDLSEKYKRALADSDTVRRKTQKFVEDAKLFGIQSFCRDLVEVQDRLQEVFTKHGLEKMKPVGGKYDPYQHEIVCHTAAEGTEPGTIALVRQDGYKLHGRTIRHAHVGIAVETQEQ